MDPLLALNLPWDQLHNLSSKQLNAADPLAIRLPQDQLLATLMLMEADHDDLQYEYNGPDG